MSEMNKFSDINGQLFWQRASDLLATVMETQAAVLHEVALLCAACIEREGVIHAFGSGHSRAFAAELVHRAGGLAPVSLVELEDLALYGDWPLARVRSLECERDPQAGRELLLCQRTEPQDLFLIASQSGVNAAIVEYALQIKQKGYPLIALTSLAHTQTTPTRHPSGKKLYELADLVIDNGTAHGDTLLNLPAGGQVCSTSSLVGVLMAQALTAEITGLLLARGIDAPIFVSDNVQGGIERNLTLQRRYEQRVHYKG